MRPEHPGGPDAGNGETPRDHPGVPDAFERLWTPHRMVYVGGQDKPADDGAGACPFCRTPGRDDEDGLVVHRGESAYVVLNLYPYNPGHLLVCPYRHVADYTDLTAAERDELGVLTATAMTVVRAVSAPHGFNLGMNQGAVAGAGIAAHLHQHIVPRWAGDANFLPVVARTKALPQVLGETRDLLAREWATTGAPTSTADQATISEEK
ncbi:HIT family protein [Georgenia subflava]|nr:HIT domain-containing protein [Georgenia subflava]